MRFIVCGLAVMLLAGCYSYEPVTLTPAPVRADVRLRITDRATADLREYLGPNVETLNGQLLAADSGNVGMAVRSIVMYNGAEQFWAGDRVTIPRTAVARVELRQFSLTRTAFLTALSLVGAVVLGDALLGGGDTEGSVPAGPVPPGQ